MKDIELWKEMRYNSKWKDRPVFVYKMCGVQEGNYDSTGIL